MQRTHRPTLLTTVPFLAGFAAIAALGCAHNESVDQPVEHTVRKVPAEAPAAAPEAKPENAAGVVMRAKEEFEHSLNQKLEELDEKVRELRLRASNLAESAKAEWNEKLATLDAKREATEAKLEEIRKSGAEAWQHLRDGAEKAWEELELAVKEAVKDF